jgi:putative endonuclease
VRVPPGILGQQAEQRAEAYLRGNGLEILDRNFRRPFGEIDLIALEGDTLVFVEVRKRSHRGYADGAESIGPAKCRRLQRTAEAYLLQHRWEGPARIDVLVLDAEDQIEWLQDAIPGRDP